jgi:hypothetical protein
MDDNWDLNALRGWAAALFAQATASPARTVALDGGETARTKFPACTACRMIYLSHHRADGLCLSCGDLRDARWHISRRRIDTPTQARIPRRRAGTWRHKEFG